MSFYIQSVHEKNHFFHKIWNCDCASQSSLFLSFPHRHNLSPYNNSLLSKICCFICHLSLVFIMKIPFVIVTFVAASAFAFASSDETTHPEPHPLRVLKQKKGKKGATTAAPTTAPVTAAPTAAPVTAAPTAAPVPACNGAGVTCSANSEVSKVINMSYQVFYQFPIFLTSNFPMISFYYI